MSKLYLVKENICLSSDRFFESTVLLSEYCLKNMLNLYKMSIWKNDWFQSKIKASGHSRNSILLCERVEKSERVLTGKLNI